jgi:predicted Zn-dependent protease
MPKLTPDSVVETLRAHLAGVKSILSAEIYLVSDDVTSVLVQGSEVLRNGFFKKRSVAVRYFTKESHSFGVCSDFDSDSITSFFNELIERSDLVLPGKRAIYPTEIPPDLKPPMTVDPTFEKTPIGEKIQRLMNLLHSFSRLDSRIQKSSRVQYQETYRKEWLWTSGSPRVVKRELTRGDVLSRVDIDDGQSFATTETRFSETHFLSFDWNLIAKLSVEKVKHKLASQWLGSGQFNLLLTPLASREWIKWIFGYLTSKNISIRNHPLRDSLGKTVTNTKFRLYDDPHFAKRPGTVHWDSEGCPTRMHDFISEGVFKQWATDRKSADLMKIPHTANSRRASADQLPEVDFHNLILEPGLRTALELGRQMEKGIVVYELKPLSDTRQSDDLPCLECWGSWSENGKEMYNLRPFFIRDPLAVQLQKCVDQGRDLVWTGRVASPTVLLENVDILGGAE